VHKTVGATRRPPLKRCVGLLALASWPPARRERQGFQAATGGGGRQRCRGLIPTAVVRLSTPRLRDDQSHALGNHRVAALAQMCPVKQLSLARDSLVLFQRADCATDYRQFDRTPIGVCQRACRPVPDSVVEAAPRTREVSKYPSARAAYRQSQRILGSSLTLALIRTSIRSRRSLLSNLTVAIVASFHRHQRWPEAPLVVELRAVAADGSQLLNTPRITNAAAIETTPPIAIRRRPLAPTLCARKINPIAIEAMITMQIVRPKNSGSSGHRSLIALPFTAAISGPSQRASSARSLLSFLRQSGHGCLSETLRHSHLVWQQQLR
jgi:hypothetical protein